MRTTLVNTFSMMDRHSPAIRSSGRLPLRCSLMMVLFMNTVHRLPSSAGAWERKAASATRSTGSPRVEAKFSRKDPHPEEQASLSMMLVTTPSFSQMAFMSWPPMSSRKVASGKNRRQPRAWATVSTVW